MVACNACAGQWPRADHRIADCGTSVAYLFEDQFFPGWTVIVLKHHAAELFQLSADQRRCMIEEVSTVAEALMAVFQPVKMNYELLGNQLPHIHWHLIPRLAGDPAPRDPVWAVTHESRALAAHDLAKRVALVQAQLSLRGPDRHHPAV